MAVTGIWYPLGVKYQYTGVVAVNWTSDTIKVALATSSYSPSIAHDYFNDITNEITGSGYTAGGMALASKSVAIVSNVIQFQADPVVWTPSTLTARYAIIYKDTGTPTTSVLLGLVDFGANIVSASGPFTIQWDASGVLNSTF